MVEERNVRFRIGRDSAANWETNNPVLLDGEPGYEDDTGKIKYGNEVDPWDGRPYAWPANRDSIVALADLTPSVDQLPYFTALATAALTTLSSFMRSVLAAVDAAAARSLLNVTGTGADTTYVFRANNLSDLSNYTAARFNLGLVIGTTVQAYNANLAAEAGLTTAANKITYWTGSGTASLTDLTSFGRSLIDDADASAGRTTLGLGTAATKNTGTSGNNVALLDGSNVWSATSTVFGPGSGVCQLQLSGGGGSGQGCYFYFAKAGLGGAVGYVGTASALTGGTSNDLLIYSNYGLTLHAESGVIALEGVPDISANHIRIRTPKTPSSASDAGNPGDICWDSNYMYVCVATNTWKRSAISSW